MMLPTVKGIEYAAQGNTLLAAAFLSSGLVGAIMTNISLKKELAQ